MMNGIITFPETSVFSGRIVCLLICICLQSGIGMCQNLVPNGDFEAYNSCPYDLTTQLSPNTGIGYSTNYSYFPTVQAWTRPLNYSTSDYFNACAPLNSRPGVPFNFFGYQQPHSGKGYAGFYTFYCYNKNGLPEENYREPISVKLLAPMKKDSQYCVSFYISPTRLGTTLNSITVNEIGAHFSDTLPYHPTALSLNLPYHVLNDTTRHLTDTSAWYEIRGIYTAAGGEEWMTIGSFRRSTFPGFTNLPPNIYDPKLSWVGYAYLDDVSVVQVKHYNRVHDTTFCDTGQVSRQAISSVTGASYTWSTGDTTQSIQLMKTGTYWCRALKDCDVFTDTFHIRFSPLSSPVVRDTVICQYTSSPMLHVSGLNLEWFTGPNSTAGSPVQPVINTTQPGRQILYVRSRNGTCISGKVPVTVTIRSRPAGGTTEHIKRCIEDQEPLVLGKPSGAVVHYQWNTMDTACCITAQRDGTYVRTVSNECGISTDTVTVASMQCEGCVLFPTAFTPNRDGLNDAFGPIAVCPVNQFAMRIYDRWGACVFVGIRISDQWDGTKNGINAPLGTYMYMASYAHAVTGKTFFIKGDITLVR